MTNSISRMKALALISLLLGVLGIVAPMIGAVGSRTGLWDFGAGLLMTPLGLALALVGLLLGILALIRLHKFGERLVLAAHGAGLSFLVSLYLASLAAQVFLVPPIYNVSTDIDDPPRFIHAQRLRAEHENPLEYDSQVIGPLQREGYPQVKPLILELAPQDAYARVKQVLLDMGMELTRDDPAAGEIEAVASTFWFDFKDDVIARLREVEGGTRLDIRSVSRLGVSDLGANADRILEVMKRVRAGL